MKSGKYFWGVVLILFGAGLVLQASNLLNLSVALRFLLPVILILVALSDLFSRGIHTFNIILFLAGAFLFLRKLNAQMPFTTFDFNLLYLVALALFIAGLSLLLRGSGVSFWARRSPGTPASDIVAIFSGREEVFTREVFENVTLTAIFGGVEYDLRQTQPGPHAVVHATAIFGGVEIYVPYGWRVEVSGIPIFGGVGNQTAQSGLEPDSPVLRVDAVAIFGGVEVQYNK